MAFKKRTATEEKKEETTPMTTVPAPIESANSRPWREDTKTKGDKNELIHVAGMFMNDKNGKQYFRGKTMKSVAGYGVSIPAGITFLLFETKEGSTVDGNLVLTLDNK